MRHRDELRAVRGALGRLGRYDLVCCIDDGLNYLLHDAELVLALGGMAAQLRRGALVLFDLNTLATYRGFFATETVVSTRSHDLCWRGLATAAFAPGQVARRGWTSSRVQAAGPYARSTGSVITRRRSAQAVEPQAKCACTIVDS